MRSKPQLNQLLRHAKHSASHVICFCWLWQTSCCPAALDVVHTPAYDYIVLTDWCQLRGVEKDAGPADRVLLSWGQTVKIMT